MSGKEMFRQLCAAESSIPIFFRDWWMDAVCGEENWNVLWESGRERVFAALPYFVKKKFGLKFLIQPDLTQTNGVWINYPQGQKYESKLSYEKKVIGKIIDQLEALRPVVFMQNFHYSFTNWLPFYWKGFKQTTRYTYVIEDISDVDKVYKRFAHNIRKEIKKAQKQVTVKEDCSIEVFYSVCSKTYKRQGVSTPFSLELLKRLDQACLKHCCRKIFYAEDELKRIHSAIYIVWDGNSAYYIAGGADPELRNSSAMSLLVWKAIQFASQFVKAFDFEGSMIEPIERFFRAFGAVQKPYFAISRGYGLAGKVYMALRRIYFRFRAMRKN